VDVRGVTLPEKKISQSVSDRTTTWGSSFFLLSGIEPGTASYLKGSLIPIIYTLLK
jgi:hypothetical protein